ncbi:RNA polymerase-binding transcription factor DksA [BD1-7 clade bacterium]|uniref:RNA polymerase-binding transcription factor DksA n=1 Tax=BD1-7 clade bacterium TaxID=2029982 RepID=A0A5S9QWE9_9GAMM|nr:RNA polymerase-binding transcription factor DksA [BD1-7 clade bacterium]CAA0122882.1 RNA polymerase-binding transcription factor DksA [BD1-7 clade bacterium]
MDIIDNAKAHEEQDRARAMHNQKASRTPEPAQHTTSGHVICIDCADPISAQRLVAKPNAARCIDCQGFFEQGARHAG